jgi:hypothetical protein
MRPAAADPSRLDTQGAGSGSARMSHRALAIALTDRGLCKTLKALRYKVGVHYGC